jgi:tetratricopeptide (TPR) repeat protein
MNVKKLTVLFAALAIFMIPAFAQNVQDAQFRTMSFEYTTVVGTLLDLDKKPVPNIKVELELAPDAELRSEITVAQAQLEETVHTLKKQVGDGVFVTVQSDENGVYTLKGVPIPGIYYVIIRNAEGYLPTKLKLSLSASDRKKFEAPEMILRPREGSGPVISDKAMKEVQKSRKALSENNLKKAIKHMQKALQIEPEYAEGYYNLGVMHMSAKNRKDAIAAIQKALEISSDYKPALKTLGELYFFQKEYQKAADCYNKYLEIREKEGDLTVDDVKLYFLTGNSYKALKQNEKAYSFFEKYLTAKEKIGLEKKDAQIFNDIGAFYYGKKDMGKAIVFFSKAIENDPDINPETYMYLGNSYLTKRDALNAMKNYQEYVNRDPKGKHVPQVKPLLEKLKTMYPDEAKKK